MPPPGARISQAPPKVENYQAGFDTAAIGLKVRVLFFFVRVAHLIVDGSTEFDDSRFI